jgi:SHS2 domain-containing protein
MSTERGHRTVPHTADVIIEAWAPDLVGCFEEAVAALVSIYARCDDAAPLAERRVQLSPGPAESQLLDLLDEVIFALDTADGIPVVATVDKRDDGGLDVVLRLAPSDRVEAVGAVPKAISHAELEVRQMADRVSCRFLVDV